MAYLNKAIEMSPLNEYNYLCKGELLLGMAKYDEAIAILRKAIQFGSIDGRAYNDIGYANFKLKKYQPAIAEYDTAVNKANKNYEPYYQYKNEAQALLKNEPAEFNYISWVCPVEDVNKLYHGILHPYEKQVDIKVKISSPQPIVKKQINLLVNGKVTEAPIIDEGDAKFNNLLGQYEYLYHAILKTPNSKSTTVAVAYNNKKSQMLTLLQ